MTATQVPETVPFDRPERGETRPNGLAVSLALSRRAVVGLWRQPQVWIPSIVFPLFFAALNTAALNRTTQLPGFPATDSFLDFLFPATITQAVLFGSVGAASELAADIEGGFFDRLVASPTWRTSILVGRLAGGAVLGACQALLFVGVFTLFGAEIKAGLAGLVVLALAAMLLALGVGGLANALALRTGSVESVQSAFPLAFITIFASSAFFPRELMNGWFRGLASANPISWMIEGMRELVLEGFDASAAATALAVPAGITVVTTGIALLALRARLARAS
ncbi:N/A [soil metagenome]|nr:ABC transporter permease [Acidimicrobiia bacterium]